MRKLFHIIVILTLGTVFSSVAQTSQPHMEARIVPDTILIGDRFFIEVDVWKDQVQTVVFPSFRRAEVDEEDPIEVIDEYPEDTVAQNGRRLHLRKRYEFTAYNEGVYSLGKARVLFADKNVVDTLVCQDSLRVHVATFQIDSTSHPIFDLKPQKTLKFKFGEITGYLGWAFVLLLVVALAIYLIDRYMARRGRRITDIFKPAPPVPPHIVAISALEQLHNQKLWQNNKHKQYYSALADILKTYIAGRYEVGAMEMTTDQLLDAVHDIEIPSKSRMDLVTILRDSDLVKFAKFTPEAEQNEDDYNKAFYFVEETKPQEAVEEEEE